MGAVISRRTRIVISAWAWAALLVGLAGTPGPAAADQATAWTEAEAAYRAGDFSGAAERFANYSDAFPDDIWGHTLRGLAQRKADRPGDAVEAFERALALDPDHRQSLVNLARASGEALTREALREGVFCRVMDPEWADALANLIADGAAWKTQQCLQNHFMKKWATEINEANKALHATQRYQDIAEHTDVAYIRRQARAEMMTAAEVSALQARVRKLTRTVRFMTTLPCFALL